MEERCRVEASSSSRGSPFFAHPMRVIEAFAARTVPGNTPDPKRSLKNARMAPPWAVAAVSSE